LTRLDPEFLRRSVEVLFESASPHATSVGRGGVGIEVELIPVLPPDRPPAPGSEALLDQVVAGISAAGRFTFEPGGQLEYSGPVCASLAASVEDVEAAVARVRAAAGAAGLDLRSRGLGPWFGPSEVGLRRPTPRYREMDRYFARRGPWGRWMMRLSASQQVNLDFGPPGEMEARWRTANDLTPLLVAVFANSPARLPGGAEVAAGRWWVWRRTDPARTGRPGGWSAVDGPRAVPPWSAYLTFALSAPVMFDAAMRPVLLDGEEAPRFTDWWSSAGEGGPEEADWRAHLGTLFPDVRPRHWMEIRAVDVPQRPWWSVPPAVLAALLYDRRARVALDERLAAIPGPAEGLCERAIRDGLADSVLREAAVELFRLAEAAMARYPAAWFGERTRGIVAEFRERFVEAGRTQADEARERGEVARLEPPSGEAAAE